MSLELNKVGQISPPPLQPQPVEDELQSQDLSNVEPVISEDEVQPVFIVEESEVPEIEEANSIERETSFLYGMVGGFSAVGIALTAPILVMLFALLKSSMHDNANVPPLEGFSSVPYIETLEERELERQHLTTDILPSVDALSKHFVALGNYVKPAVVVIRRNDKANTVIGSGFIYSSDGYIVTNAHVVRALLNKNAQVSLYDGKTLEGKIIGVIQEKDIAVIKVNETNLPYLNISYDNTEAGELVMVVAFQPPNFGWSLSTGILSGENRNYTVNGMLQTDATMNHGCSGSPLLNMKGKVIGLNSSVTLPNGTSGFGFSVPAKELDIYVPMLIDIYESIQY